MNALSGFLITSLFFVIATMVEFAIVLAIKRINDVNLEKTPEGPFFNLESMDKKKKKTRLAGKKKTMLLTKSLSLTDKIDGVSLIIFIASYFLFCFVYFVHYL